MKDPRPSEAEVGPVWRQGAFRSVWLATSLNSFSNEVGLLAFPTIAITMLHFGPVEIGLLRSLENVAVPVLGLLAGVWVDRFFPSRVMMLADVSRCLVLLSLPAVVIFGTLIAAQLYFAAVAVGICVLFFQTASASLLPLLLKRSALVEGNSYLMLGSSTARIVGPWVTGIIISGIGVAYAFAASAVSLLVSFAAVLSTSALFTVSRPTGNRTDKDQYAFFAETKNGIRFVFGNPTLRALTLITTCYNAALAMVEPMLVVFAYETLHLDAKQLGFILGLSSIGLLVCSLVSPFLSRRLGLGRCIALSTFLLALGFATLPLAAYGMPQFVLCASWFCKALSWPIYNINQLALRQAITPIELQGRMNATMRTIFWSVIPVGSLMGGILVENIGMTATFLSAGAIGLLAVMLVVVGPVFPISDPPSQQAQV
jgi:MFS family permease